MSQNGLVNFNLIGDQDQSLPGSQHAHPDSPTFPPVPGEAEHSDLLTAPPLHVLQTHSGGLVFRAVVHHDYLPTLHSGRVGLELEEQKYITLITLSAEKKCL